MDCDGLKDSRFRGAGREIEAFAMRGMRVFGMDLKLGRDKLKRHQLPIASLILKGELSIFRFCSAWPQRLVGDERNGVSLDSSAPMSRNIGTSIPCRAVRMGRTMSKCG
jgi:hypothetical protein